MFFTVEYRSRSICRHEPLTSTKSTAQQQPQDRQNLMRLLEENEKTGHLFRSARSSYFSSSSANAQGVGRSAQRDGTLSLRSALLVGHDRLLVSGPSRAVHSTVSPVAGWPFRSGRSSISFHQGGLVVCSPIEHGRRQGVDSGIYLPARLPDQRQPFRSLMQTERSGPGRCWTSSLV